MLSFFLAYVDHIVLSLTQKQCESMSGADLYAKLGDFLKVSCNYEVIGIILIIEI